MNDETKAKLAEIRAKREVVEGRRAARALVTEVEAETQALVEAETLDALENEHGPVGKGIGYVRVPDGRLLVVKKPASASYRKFADSKQGSTEAALALIKGCAVWPKDKAELAALLDEYSAALVPLTKIAVALAGFQDPEGKD